jgi:hypothetical protein
MTRTTIAQIGAAALFLVIGGSVALSRVLGTDPVGPDGHKCIFPYYIGDVRIPENEDAILNAEVYQTWGVRSAAEKFCAQASAQAIADLRLHPFATVFGALFPTLILTPVAYWLSGFGIRRYQARALVARGRYKICEFCAERIKAEAKVCRYCGRDVTHPRQTDVEATS